MLKDMASAFATARSRSQLRRDRLGSSSAREAGWTLIELMVVLSIIMIMMSMALVTYSTSVRTAREAALHSDLFLMRDAIDQYYADKAKYPDSLQTLVSEGYLRQIPKNPFDANADWRTEQSQQAGTNTSDNGIYEVKSGFSGTALDGSDYSDW
jgi:general secretion pathway protein G